MKESGGFKLLNMVTLHKFLRVFGTGLAPRGPRDPARAGQQSAHAQ